MVDEAGGRRLGRRGVLGMGAALGAAGLLGGIAMPGRTFAQGRPSMTFLTPFGYSLAFAPVLYAKAGGFFDEQELDVAVEGGKGAAQAAQLVVAGRAGAARTGGGNFIQAAADQDAPLVSIATIAQVSPFSVISSGAEPIGGIGEFAGRTIGLASLGGSMEATLDLMLMRGGVALDQVKREKVPDTPVGYALIGAGRIDGYMGNVSTAVRLKNADPEVSVWKVDDGIPGQVYVATRAMIEKEPETLVRFLRAVHRSASAILDAEDLAPVMEAIGSQFEIRTLAEPEVAVQDLRANAELWVAHGRENLLRNVPERWAGAVADMRRANIISKDVDPAMLYDNALLEKALA